MIGRESALRLAHSPYSMGNDPHKARFYVPRPENLKPTCRVVRAIGLKSARLLSSRYGGGELKMAKARRIAKRNERAKFKFFGIDEFACPCCGVNDISEELVHKLDLARHITNQPFMITSGFRCAEHNLKVGGSVASSHLKGLAADIATPSSSARFEIVRALITAGFRRIGRTGDDNAIHCDIDEDKPQCVLW